MFTPVSIWICTAAIVAVIVLVSFVNKVVKSSKGRIHVFEMGHERDEFWIPGDKPISSDDEYDDYDN